MSVPELDKMINKPRLLEFQVENCGRTKTLEAINSLSSPDPLVKEPFLEIWHGKATEIHTLYSQISKSSNPKILDLVTSTILLQALFLVSFARESAIVVEKLLSTSPAPPPGMKTFINDHISLGALYLDGCPNPEIWTVMLKHGYLNADINGSALEHALTYSLAET